MSPHRVHRILSKMALYLLIVALISVAGKGALAGHPLWEHSSTAPIGSALTWNGTAPDTEKRWLTIQHGTGHADIHLWPDKTISYCFESAATKTRLFDDLIGARNKWKNSGLPDDFGWREVTAAECQSNRENVLLIRYQEGDMATTPGKVPLGPGVDGPSMTLTDDETKGLLNKVSNYAHEMGHAWGLYHEHQNPHFWPSLFGLGHNFNCQNLKDYEIVQARIQARIDSDPSGMAEITLGDHREKVCTDRAIAQLYRFSASDYLPFHEFEVRPMTTDPSQIDYDSIMIYPSGAGGLGTAQPGGPDNRRPILTKADGSPIPINLNPSPRDVAGLVELYGQQQRTDAQLLQHPRSSKRAKFLRLFKGSGSSNACV